MQVLLIMLTQTLIFMEIVINQMMNWLGKSLIQLRVFMGVKYDFNN